MDFAPDFAPDLDPGFDAGFDPVLGRGFEPGVDADFDPVLDPGFDAGFDPVLDRGFEPGFGGVPRLAPSRAVAPAFLRGLRRLPADDPTFLVGRRRV